MTFHLKYFSGECNKGVIITIEDLPEEGLKLHGEGPWGASTPVYIVKPRVSTVVLSGLGAGKWKFTLSNMAGDTMDIMRVTVPEAGCPKKKMYGWLGRKYRTKITTSPSTPSVNRTFKLQATLIINPNRRAGEDMEIEFFKLVEGKEKSLGTNVTNEHGVAVLAHKESEKGTYTYLARYTGADTYAEKKEVSVGEYPAMPGCPIEISAIEEKIGECPILKATEGTIIFTKLDTLRWFRDNHMPKTLVNIYYWLTPITGRIARYSRIARIIIRWLTKISIDIIENRYSHTWKS